MMELDERNYFKAAPKKSKIRQNIQWEGKEAKLADNSDTPYVNKLGDGIGMAEDGSTGASNEVNAVTTTSNNNSENPVARNAPKCKLRKHFNISVEIDMMSVTLFVMGLATRMYRLEEPRSIVFDELHYGKYVSLYMKRTFFFDSHPPLGKQLIAAISYLASFDGQFKFDRIGSSYADTMPLFALRFVPALCGSMVIPIAYHLMLELGLSQWTAVLAGLLLLCDNALLTQSRFILMESMLLMFALFGLLCVMKFRRYHEQPYCLQWWGWLSLGAASLTCALCVKYVGFFSCCLSLAMVGQDFWQVLANKQFSDFAVFCNFLARAVIIVVVPISIYLAVFYVHLSVLSRAGPHDSVMTSAFQASLEGGLASITRGQPLEVAHGSQVTLRHTHGRTCWLHSHAHVYPLRYPDKRGSSHQQQVTCYSFKDVNNWWIVKRPERNDLAVSYPVDAIRHGDVIQLVHGLTSRAFNSHDVAAAMSPQNQEVSCYIDYNVSMPAQNLWRVEILNRDQVGDVWHTIESLVHLIHVNSSQALKFSGRQLPDWGFNQHEVVTDRIVNQDDTVWNVEEHRYTKSEDQKDRERELVNAEMIPLRATTLSFWEKFVELQYKMLFANQENVQNHMYSSEPLDWPFMVRGIAYWVSPHSNFSPMKASIVVITYPSFCISVFRTDAIEVIKVPPDVFFLSMCSAVAVVICIIKAQVHLLGNVVVWWSGTVSLVVYTSLLVFYLLRQRRQCYDMPPELWRNFMLIGEVLLGGYLFHYLPYFFVDRTLFLHHYLLAFTFKVLLTAALIEHLHHIISLRLKWRAFSILYKAAVAVWMILVLWVFRRFTALSYGTTPLTAADVLRLRWMESWDFIIHRQ